MNHHPTRKYVILPAGEVGDVDFDTVLEDSSASLCRSVDGSLRIVKYEGLKPQCLSGKTTLTHLQIQEELKKSEWVASE